MPSSHYNLRYVMQSVADSIRDKLGYEKEDYPIKPTEFATEIMNFPQGSGGSTYVDPAPILEGTIESVTNGAFYIKSQTFAFCNNLSYAEFPECISMGTSVFQSCPILTTALFPKLETMQENAFMSCSALKSVDFPECTSIAQSAFFNCSNISYISLPKCSYVGSDAFYNCASLISLYLPECLSINSNAFYNCSNLANANIQNVEYVGNNAFIGANSAFSNLSLSKCSYIGASAFYNTVLSSISLPECEHIGSYAFGSGHTFSTLFLPKAKTLYQVFRNCSNLTEVSLPEVTWMSYTFSNCHSLTSIYAPKLEYIEGALRDCTQLSEVSFPNLKSIGPYTFTNCSNLTSFYFPNIISISSYAWQSCPLSEFNYSLLSYIGTQGVQNGKFSKVSLPKLLQLSSWGFAYCYSLETAFIPLCQNIYNSAFLSCSKLSEVILYISSCNITPFSSVFKNTPIMNSTYLGYYGSIYVPSRFVSVYQSRWSSWATRITSLPASVESANIFPREFVASTLTSIPDDKLNATSVWQYAFCDCTKLTEINLPNCLIVDDYAFYNCASLTNINLPECSYLGSNAFAYVNNIINISLPKVRETDENAFYGCNNIKSINLPLCEKLGKQTMMTCRNLSSISIPICLEIGSRAFAYCSSALSNISLPNVTTICDYAFRSCSNLSSIYMPNANQFGSGVFEGTNFSEIPFRSDITFIPESCFAECNNLKDTLDLIRFSIIGNSAFNYCYGLSTVLLGEPELGYATFSYCTAIKSAYMLGGYFENTNTFYGCRNLSSVYIYSTSMLSYNYSLFSSQTWGGIFYETPIASGSGHIYVRQSLVSYYKNDTMWKKYTNCFVGMADEQIHDIFAGIPEYEMEHD